MKLRNWFKENKIFFFISLTVLSTAIIGIFFEYIGTNPFAGEVFLDSPVQVVAGAEKMYYITGSSSEILVTDKDWHLLYVIQGDDGQESFAYADSLTYDENGSIYVLDQFYADEGSTVYCERILYFEPGEKTAEVLYEVDTLDEEGNQIIHLDNLCVENGTLYFSRIVEDRVELCTLADGIEEVKLEISLNEAWKNVADTTSNPSQTALAVAMKNGDVYWYNDQESRCIYSAREHDTEEYFSMIAEVAYGADGALYLCDVGLREVYRLSPDGQECTAVIPRSTFSTLETDEFAIMPIYTGLNVGQGMITVLAAEYFYDEVTDEEIYNYRLAMVSESGEIVWCADVLQNSTQRYVEGAIAYAAVILMLSIFVYAVITIFQLLRQNQIEQSIKIQFIMIVTALVVTFGISYLIINNFNKRFVSEAEVKLSNVAYLISESVDKKYLEMIDSPDAYYSSDYADLHEDVGRVLNSSVNAESYMYCVIYKEKNNVVYEVYRDDIVHGAMYPMAGEYSNSIEEYIAAENEYYFCDELTLAEGSYMYALVPVYSETGETIGFVETGMDYATYSEENSALSVKVMMLAVMAVVIVVLVFSEILYTKTAIQIKRVRKEKYEITLPDAIRPISFLFFMIANMSTAFLPIYGMNLWTEEFPLQAELAAALPISAELTVAALTSFGFGFIIQKTGVRPVCGMGAVCYLVGNIVSAFAPNLWCLIFANIMCGLGSGCLTIGLNSWAASYKDESLQNKGFVHINAAYLAGLNCGTVIGSLIWENFGIDTVYFAAAAGSIVLFVLSIWLIGTFKVEAEEDEDDEGGTGHLKDLFTPSVLRFFLCITVPYLVCTAFLEFFFPIQAEQAGLSATHISMAFLLSGLISIYIGSSLAEPITKQFGTKKAMILASFIYAAALMYLVLNPSVWSCYIVVVFFAVADSFGLSAQSVYYSTMDEVKKVGQSKALGVNSMVESATSACGSLIFGAALLLGTQMGIFVIGTVFSVLLLAFVIGERRVLKK